MCWQGRDYWARFERFVKTLAWSSDDVYIVTGPLYVPQRTPQGYVMQYPMIGLSHSASAHIIICSGCDQRLYFPFLLGLLYALKPLKHGSALLCMNEQPCSATAGLEQSRTSPPCRHSTLLSSNSCQHLAPSDSIKHVHIYGQPLLLGNVDRRVVACSSS